MKESKEYKTYITVYPPLGSDNLPPIFRESFDRQRKDDVPRKRVRRPAPRNVVYRNDVTVFPNKVKDGSKSEFVDQVR